MTTRSDATTVGSRSRSNYQLVLGAVVVTAMLVSLVRAPYPDQMYLQHIPTVLALLAWPAVTRRYPLTNAAASCFAAFLLMHILGARYIYSYVPYDHWSQHLFGFDLQHAP